MIYDSDTNSDISENQLNNHSMDEPPYDHKLALIWDGIQKTKNLQPSDYEDNQETYQMYKHKRVSQDKQLNYDKPHSSLQNKILNNLKTKNRPEPQTQQKKPYLQQKNSPSQNKPTHHHHKNLPYNHDLEEKLQKSKQNTNILMKKLIQAQEQIDYLENQLEKQLNEKQQLLLELKQKNYQMQIQAQAKTQEKQNKLMNSNRIDQSVIEAQITIDKYRLRLRAAQKQIQQKNTQFAQLEKQLKQLTSELHSNHLQFNQTPNQKPTYKGSELLELNQAYKTIQRMTALLKSTDEYRLLGNFAEDVKNIHFLSKIPQKIKSQISTVKLNPKTKEKKSNCQHCTEVKINQRLLWTPSLCYKKMLQMKMKYQSLNEECIEQVLFEMNKLYLSKEETRVTKLKTYYETQIDKLKKKTQLTYDQILAKKQIERLKKQLQTKKKPTKSMRAPSDPNVQEKLKKFNNNSSNLDNLRVIGQYEDQLRLKDKEVKLLMERIKLLESQTSSYDKSLYMEGVLWIIDKILEELDTNGDDIREFEDKFRAKMSSASTAEEWIRLFKEFFESVEELNNTLIEKILSIKENTINKMSYAKLQ